MVLVCAELPGEDASVIDDLEGVLTTRGGATSHAAVGSRSRAKPCVAGCTSLAIDDVARTARGAASGVSFAEGDWVSLDGSTGEVFRGSLGTVMPRLEDQSELRRIIGWAAAR